MFVDHTTDRLFVHDAVTEAIVDVNQQACTSLGHSRDELIGAASRLFDPHAFARGARRDHRMTRGR